jgi:hypothetical protein
MQIEAAVIPEKLAAGLISDTMKIEELIDLKHKLDVIINFLNEKNNSE